MFLNQNITIKPDHILCKVSGEFSAQEGAKGFQTLLVRCVTENRRLALVDATAINESHTAIEKLMWAQQAETVVKYFKAMHKLNPRVAIFGKPPMVTDYKPDSEFLEQAGIDVRIFDSREQAKTWLFAKPAKTRRSLWRRKRHQPEASL